MAPPTGVPEISSVTNPRTVWARAGEAAQARARRTGSICSLMTGRYRLGWNSVTPRVPSAPLSALACEP